jgi:hypothetical protein
VPYHAWLAFHDEENHPTRLQRLQRQHNPKNARRSELYEHICLSDGEMNINISRQV